MALSFYVANSVPAENWVSYLDPSYWTGSSLEDWDGEKYITDNLSIIPGGGWEVGFRPAQIKIDFTHIGADPTARVEGDPGDYILWSGSYGPSESPAVEDLVFVGNDISKLVIYSSGGPFHITGIWFK